MFVSRHFLALLAVAAAVLLAVARPSGGTVAEERYVVRSGDTLWQLASERYGGDPREGVWRIRERNDLQGTPLAAGTVIYLPAVAGGA
jgi:hypothetical protein